MSDQLHPDREALKQFLAVDKVRQHNETRSVLDALRKTRKARGGVGAPLEIPANLRSAANGQGIIVTDADLRPDTPMPESFRRNTTAGGRDVEVEE